jgi:hypothetical protein
MVVAEFVGSDEELEGFVPLRGVVVVVDDALPLTHGHFSGTRYQHILARAGEWHHFV